MKVRLSFLSVVVAMMCIGASCFSDAQAQQDTLRDPYRHFIMPTGKSGDGGWLGFWELAFFQAGYAFDNVGSISGGFTAMPTVSFKSQFAFLQGKVTIADEGPLSFAVGANLLRMTSQHLYTHIFAVGTYETPDQTRFTGLFLYKLAGDDFADINVLPYGSFSLSYGGAVGGGVGFDTPIGLKNMRLVAELWNHDLQSPSKLAALAALRVESENFSSDFGFMYFAVPLIAPVANFVYRFH